MDSKSELPISTGRDERTLDGLSSDTIPALYAGELTYQTEFGAGACELMGLRDSQEDALMMMKLDYASLSCLSVEELGNSLVKAIKALDDEILADTTLDHQGATASVTIIQGNDIVTATVGDSVAFAVIYDENDNPHVQRLNHRLHAPDEPEELKRLEAFGVIPVRMDEQGIKYSMTDVSRLDSTEVRLASGINMSRSLGDKSSRKYGAISDPDIDITSITELVGSAMSNDGFVGAVKKIQIITTCDGFTQMADKISKSHQHSAQDHKKLQEGLLIFCLKNQGMANLIQQESKMKEDLVRTTYSSTKESLLKRITVCQNSQEKLRDSCFGSEDISVRLSESELATKCAKFCLFDEGYNDFRVKNGRRVTSSDNISVVVQTIPLDGSVCAIHGVFDGHGGAEVSRFLGQSFGDEFSKQCYDKCAQQTHHLKGILKSSVDSARPENAKRKKSVRFSDDCLTSKDDDKQTDVGGKHKQQILSDLDKYIKRIESYKDYKQGFIFFPESRGINRHVNYLLAKSLKAELEKHTDIRELFSKDSIEALRSIAVQKVPDGPQYEYRGINSDELNKIIKKARTLPSEDNKFKP